MKKERFEQLAESVREGFAITRGEIPPSRVFELPDAPRFRTEKRFALCIDTDNALLLIPRKIYEVTILNDKRVKVIDEEGEAVLSPIEFFILLELPPEIQRALQHAKS